MDFVKLKTAMGELEEDTVLEIIRDVMADGGSQAGKAMEACQEGMNIVGDLFAEQEYFVSDLIFAGELMSTAMDILRPALARGGGESLGRMILCTVEGDLHDIGKNIVRAMLEAGGFEVLDLGIDVKPATIIDTAKAEGIRIIGLSGVLTLAIDSMKDTVDAFVRAGMRDEVKFIIGGAPITADVCPVVGADAWAVNPADTVKTCQSWVAV